MKTPEDFAQLQVMSPNSCSIADAVSSKLAKRHIVFAKIHKAASSTVHNILTRFALRYGLNAMSRMHNMHIHQNSDKIFQRDLVPIPSGSKYDILCCHLIFNKSRIAPYFPNDTSYVGIVREPFQRFLSAFIYFSYMYPEKSITPIVEANPKDPVSAFLEEPSKWVNESHPKSVPINNRMSVDFGFPLDDFKNAKKDKAKINTFLHYLNSTFDLIMVKEMFDESLVLLRRQFHWKMKDILYLNVNTFNAGNTPNASTISDARSWVHKQNYSEHVKNKFRDWAAIDIALYDFFLREFRRRVTSQPPDFFEEVKTLKILKNLVAKYCSAVNSTNTTSPSSCSYFPATDHSEEMTLTKRDCELMTMDEMYLTETARNDTIFNRLKMTSKEYNMLFRRGIDPEGRILGYDKSW